ncbi:MAG: NAD(P)-binding domain-containing protein [Planctomycetes bacterium]|nr:NAD(P)-binding domain-containing protein [Planctomycetota bacterium]
MQLFVLGADHRCASLSELGRARLLRESIEARLIDLCRNGASAGAVLIDTCNRFEVLFEIEHADAAAALRKGVRQTLGDLPLRELRDLSAVEHLIRVTTGLESLVPGEEQILGQVTRAFRAAEEVGLSSRRLHSLGSRITAVARMLRGRKPDQRVPRSVADLAARVAREHGARVAVVGAGAMARAAAEELRRLDVEELWLVNRTVARAEALARHFGGRAQSLDEFLVDPPRVEVVILALAGRELALPHARLSHLRSVVDISQPTVLHPETRERTDLAVLDLIGLGAHAQVACQDLGRWIEDSRELAHGHARRLWIEVSGDRTDLQHLVNLHVDAAREEMEKARRNGLAQLPPEQMDAVAKLVERVARRNAHLHVKDLRHLEPA